MQVKDIMHNIPLKTQRRISYFAASVIPLARVTFSVFVGAYGAHGFTHIIAYIVLRGNKFQTCSLSVFFSFDKVEYST